MGSDRGWEIGEQMSQEEGDDFIETVQWSDIIVATTHPWPGGYFSDPYQGHHLKATADGELFDWTPDTDSGFDNDAPTYLGKFQSDEELLDIAVDFVLSGDHEVSAAVFFHFKDEAFASWPGYFAAAIPEFYWFRCEYEKDDFPSRLDAHLIMSSPLYKHLVGFFQMPESPEFADAKQAITDDESFGALFERYKYSR